MTIKKTISLLVAIVMTLSVISVSAFAQTTEKKVTFSFSQIDPSTSLELGDTVTFKVALTENDGFCVGSLYFKPSENLSYVSSTLLGNAIEANEVVDGENIGTYVIPYINEQPDSSDESTWNYSEASDEFCTITFKVEGLNEIKAELSAVGFFRSEGDSFYETVAITPEIVNPELSVSVSSPEKPSITTGSLPDAIKGKNYSQVLVSNAGDLSEYVSWEVSSGELPEGITLSSDGTLSGAPTTEGTYTFSVVASLFESVSSDPKELSIVVLEKASEIELDDESGYAVDGDEYLTKVIAGTSLKAFLENFKNAEDLKVYNASGQEITGENALVGTGATVKLIYGNETLDTLTVVVLGDVNGNGKIESNDYLRVRYHLNGNDGFTLVGAFFKAALASGRDTIISGDYLRIRQHINGNFDIYSIFNS